MTDEDWITDMQDELALAGFTDGQEYLWDDVLKELEEIDELRYMTDDWTDWDSSGDEQEDTPAPVETKEAPMAALASNENIKDGTEDDGKIKLSAVWQAYQEKGALVDAARYEDYVYTPPNKTRYGKPGPASHPRYRHYGGDVRFYGFTNNVRLLRQNRLRYTSDSVQSEYVPTAIWTPHLPLADNTLVATNDDDKAGTVMGWQGNGYFDPPIAGEEKIMSAPKRLNSSYHQPWIVDQRGKKGKKDAKPLVCIQNDLINDETTMHDAPVRKVRDKTARLPYERKKHKRRLIFRANKAKRGIN